MGTVTKAIEETVAVAGVECSVRRLVQLDVPHQFVDLDAACHCRTHREADEAECDLVRCRRSVVAS